MKFDFFYIEKVCWCGTNLLLFAILHLSLQLVCQNLCEHGIDWCHLQMVLGLRQLILLLYTFTLSLLYNIKSKGPNIDPCGTPHVIFIKSESLVLYDTY